MAGFQLGVPPVLMQNKDNWNFHGLLTSNNGTLI